VWGPSPAIVRQFPPRFPPIGVYELLMSYPGGFAGAGDALLLQGTYPVYFTVAR
jgi:hypothetical protein